jgi:hypothetical protein
MAPFKIKLPKNKRARQIICDALLMHDLTWDIFADMFTDPWFLFITAGSLYAIRQTYLKNHVEHLIRKADAEGISALDIESTSESVAMVADNKDVRGRPRRRERPLVPTNLVTNARSTKTSMKNFHPVYFVGAQEKIFQKKPKRERLLTFSRHRSMTYVILALFAIPSTRHWIVDTVGRAICYGEKFLNTFYYKEPLSCDDDIIKLIKIQKEGRHVRRVLDGKWVHNEALEQIVTRYEKPPSTTLLRLAQELDKQIPAPDHTPVTRAKHNILKHILMSYDEVSKQFPNVYAEIRQRATWAFAFLDVLPEITATDQAIIDSAIGIILSGLDKSTQEQVFLLKNARALVKDIHNQSVDALKKKLETKEKDAAITDVSHTSPVISPVDPMPEWIALPATDAHYDQIVVSWSVWKTTFTRDMQHIQANIITRLNQEWADFKSRVSFIGKFDEFLAWYFLYYLSLKNTPRTLANKSQDESVPIDVTAIYATCAATPGTTVDDCKALFAREILDTVAIVQQVQTN